MKKLNDILTPGKKGKAKHIGYPPETVTFEVTYGLKTPIVRFTYKDGAQSSMSVPRFLEKFNVTEVN